jgi:uncharacterized SAM-binding protein YcdF (DUF218 family)
VDHLLFVAKKLAGVLVMPAGLAALAWLAGAVLWLARPGRRLGPGLMLAAGLGLFALATPAVGWLLLHPVEGAAGPAADPAELAAQGVGAVVVLSGSNHPAQATPAGRCGASTTMRLLEGVRLWRGLEGASLVLSGGSHAGGPPAARTMAGLAGWLGVPEDALVLETGSWDTEDQARRLARLLAGRRAALVTQAAHLPRALAMFRAYGLHCLPAPADRATGPALELAVVDLVPSAAGLEMSRTAFYERVGLLWFRLRQLLGLAPAAGVTPRPEPAAAG